MPHHNSTSPASGQASIPQNVYRRHLLRARAAGNYFLAFRPLFRILPKTTALFLQDLINVASMEGVVRDGGWFLCSIDFLKSRAGIGWSEKEQRTCLGHLGDAGFVETQNRKNDRGWMRWIYVNVVEIEKALDEAEGQEGEGCCPDGQHPSCPDGRKKEGTPTEYSKDVREAAPAGRAPNPPAASRISTPKPTANTPAKEKKSMTPALDIGIPAPTPRAAVEDVDRRRAARIRRNARRMGWRADFSARRCAGALAVLRRKLGANHGEIDAVLDWYEANRVKKPVVCNGRELDACWEWLKRLMAKDTPARVRVSPAAQRVADRMNNLLIWPGDVVKDLPAAVQVGIDGVKSAWASLDAVAARRLGAEARKSSRASEVPRLADFLAHRIVNAPEYVADWFEREHDWIARKKAVNVDLLKRAPGLGNPDFVKELRTAASDYGTSDAAFERLMKEVADGPG